MFGVSVSTCTLLPANCPASPEQQGNVAVTLHTVDLIHGSNQVVLCIQMPGSWEGEHVPANLMVVTCHSSNPLLWFYDASRLRHVYPTKVIICMFPLPSVMLLLIITAFGGGRIKAYNWHPVTPISNCFSTLRFIIFWQSGFIHLLYLAFITL